MYLNSIGKLTDEDVDNATYSHHGDMDLEPGDTLFCIRVEQSVEDRVVGCDYTESEG